MALVGSRLPCECAKHDWLDIGESMLSPGRIAHWGIVSLLGALVFVLWIAPAGANEAESADPPRTLGSYAVLAIDGLCALRNG